MIPSPANIEFLHSYLVRSNIKDEDYKPSGAILSLRGAVFNLISKIFERADEECSIDISFKAGEDRSQNNSTRDLLVKVLEASVEEDRSDLTALLADNLLSLTNGRTGAGLLFVIGGKAKGHSRIMLCRFPADEGIKADDDGEELKVEVMQDLFMKNRNSYKAVFFDKLGSKSTRREGKAVDKQVNDLRNPPSHYWIEGFLKCTLTSSPRAGSERLANALREVFNTTRDLNEKEQIASVSLLLPNLAGHTMSSRGFLEAANLSSDIVDKIEERMGTHVMNESFVLDKTFFTAKFRFRAKLLDNGVMISAEADKYDEVVQESQEDGKTVNRTTGKLVDSKIQQTQAGRPR